MLNFHLTPALNSHFSLRNHLDETFWFRDITTVFKGKRRPETSCLHCPVETAQLRKRLAVSRLIMCDIQKLKADATFTQLRIAEVTIIYHVLIFILYPIIIFLLWQVLTYYFPYGHKGVSPSLIIDKAILMAAEQQHHLWCWKKAYEVSSPTAGV